MLKRIIARIGWALVDFATPGSRANYTRLVGQELAQEIEELTPTETPFFEGAKRPKRYDEWA